LRENRSLKIRRTLSEQKFDVFCGICAPSSNTLQVQRPQKARIFAASGKFYLGWLRFKVRMREDTLRYFCPDVFVGLSF